MQVLRLTFLLLVVSTFQLKAEGSSQTITIQEKNASIEHIFALLEQKTGYQFVFNSHMLAGFGRVDVAVTDGSISDVLDQCFKNRKLTYLIRNRMIIVKEKDKEKPTALSAEAILPQTLTPVKPVAATLAIVISGVVRDENNKPVDGAAVSVKSLHIGTTTDKDGKFELSVPEGSYQLEITYVGYKGVVKTVVVGKDSPEPVTVSLQPNSTGLNEVVVVGYGTQAKRNVTGSIATVRGDDIKNLPISNAATALQGRAAGVDIVRNDGSPGSVPSIRIRGTGTINNSDPLVVIDGVPAGGLNDVSPNDIASVEILKDASASAIYGSRAANGVVLITTKKGNFSDNAKTTLNIFTGTNKVTKYLDMLKAPDLEKLKAESYTNDGLTVPTVWTDPYYATQRTDWQRALFGKGKVNNADIAVRGGNANSSYSFSGNYYDEKGIIYNSYFKRYNFRINSEHKIGTHLKVGENIFYSSTDNNAPDTKSTQAGLVWSTIRFNPAIPVYNEDGSYGSSQADNQLGDINNPIATVHESHKYNKIDRILANAYAELMIVKGLTIRANYAFDQAIYDNYDFEVAMPDQTRGPSQSTINRYSEKDHSPLEEYFLTYNHNFNDVHDITFTAGYSAQTFYGNFFNANRTGFNDTSADQRVLNLGNSSSAGNSGNNIPSSGLQSYFGRINYAFKNRYLLTATMRADGSSKFAPGKRWGYFPAFSAGWRVSDEPFFTDNMKRAVSTLKITGGWGQLGNQNIGNFQYLSTIGYGGGGGLGGGGFGYNLGTGTTNYNGAYVTGLANANITWERAVMTNISLEAATLQNHLTAVVTYFNKNTTDMLIPFQLVETFGAQTNLPDDPGNVTLPNQNIGKLNNHGVEVELIYQNKAGKVGYSFGVNGSFLSNKVTRLYGKSTYIASTAYGRENADISRTYEGQPIASFYGFRTDGLYQSQADIDKDPGLANDPNKANIKPGDVKFVDASGNGVIDDSDRVNLGNPNPKFVFGFHGAVNFAGFDLAFNFAGSTGFKIYNADRLAGLDATQVFNWYADQNKRWTGAGSGNDIPRLSHSNLNNNYRSSDKWVQNGSFLSLKTISLGYSFAKQTFGIVTIPDIRIYVSSYNLLTLTGYKGYTPELGYTNDNNSSKPANSQRGVDLAQYPATRNFTIGATVNF